MMNDKDAFQKMLKARTSLVLKHPFFASLALRLELREDNSCKNAWTDGHVFAYNPNYVNILPENKLEGLAAHIVMHPACGHHRRRGTRNQKIWNRACDYAINGILLDAGFTLPDSHLFREQYKNKNAEAIYDELTRGENAEEVESEPLAEDSDSHAEVENEQQETEEQVLDDTKNEQRSSAPDDSEVPGEVRDDPGEGTTASSNTTETDWEEALIQAAHTARDLGKIPTGIERLLKKKLLAKLGWQELLSRFIERTARSDYSWVTPNKRYLHQNIYLPAIQNNELSRIVLAIDTSGSIQQEELEQFTAELHAIMDLYPTTTHLFFCDAEIQEHIIVEQADMLGEIKPKGGGGTDYRPVFSAVEEHAIRPSCLIYLTDLECRGFPEEEPNFPVLWVKTGDAGVTPPFGEIIMMDEDRNYAH